MTAGDPRNWMWGEACAMIERAEQLHRQFFQPDLSSLQAVNWEPPVDIFETARELLIVAGQRRLPAARGATIHRLEIPHGRFERRIRLPAARLRLDRSELASGCLFLRLSKLS
jgi:HSP20 family molecular chaperone IbpA